MNKPFTTTSSILSTSASIVTLNGLASFTGISIFFIPINVNSSTLFPPSGTVIVNLPFISEAHPTDVPFSNTVTPGNNSPFSSFTIPVTVITFPGSSFFKTGETMICFSSILYPNPVPLNICFTTFSSNSFFTSTETLPTFANRLLLYTKSYPVFFVIASKISRKAAFSIFNVKRTSLFWQSPDRGITANPNNKKLIRIHFLT